MGFFSNNSATDPVFAMEQYANSNLAWKGPNSPLFLRSDGTQLTRDYLISRCNSLARLAGFGSGFNGISFRRGGATSLASAGIGYESIMKMGRWRSLAFTHYLHPSLQDYKRHGSAMGLVGETNAVSDDTPLSEYLPPRRRI